MDFDEKTFLFLKSRVIELGAIVNNILSILQQEPLGLYHDELLSKLKYSETVFRPAIYSLYTSGFIDRTTKGNMKIYTINKNGLKLFKEIIETGGK